MHSLPGHLPLSQFGGAGVARASQPDEKTIDDHLAVQAIIRSYQVSDSLAKCRCHPVQLPHRTHAGCVFIIIIVMLFSMFGFELICIFFLSTDFLELSFFVLIICLARFFCDVTRPHLSFETS